MDGPAIKFGLGTSPGAEWLREIVPTLGQRLKVHNVLRSLCIKEQIEVCTNKFLLAFLMKFFGLIIIFCTPYRVPQPSQTPLILAQLAQWLVGTINRTLHLFPSNVSIQVSAVSTVASNQAASDDSNVASNSVTSGSKNPTTPSRKVHL